MGVRLHSSLRFAPAQVDVEKRADGSMVLRSPQKLRPHSRALGEWLVHWAGKTPKRAYLAERAGESWRKVTYSEALDSVRRIGQSLLELGVSLDHPVAALSENSIDHALLALAAMHIGVPVVPISPAYALMSKDFAKLKYIFDLIRPRLVYVADGTRYAPALAAVALGDAKLVFGANPPEGGNSVPFSSLLDSLPDARVDAAFAAVGPETIAKILFTSGSTGFPKGVINTQRMLCANQQMWAQVWPFLDDKPPVLVDWQPWNHTAGGNICFNIVLRNGGTFYVDNGKPLPGLIEATAKNLREVSPTIYFNVPRGFDLLLPFLESDADLRLSFFRDLDVVVNAGAMLPQNLWDRIETLAVQERGGNLAISAGWGSTETAPGVTLVHFDTERAGNIGLPLPGCELRLVPFGSKLEVRVRGPNVTPGYYRRDDLTQAAFDDEGFYRIGDAVKLADPADPAKGLMFDGRLMEDFKLSTGTWVNVGTLRVRLIAACNPLVQDAVIAGQNRDEVGALVFLNSAAARRLCPDAAADAGSDDLARRSEVRTWIATAMRKLAIEFPGSSMHATRALVMVEQPLVDAGEITDKGYINQRAVLDRRDELVQKLYASPVPAEVITAA